MQILEQEHAQEPALNLNERWKLIYKKISEGNEADKKESCVEILERIQGHLQTVRRKHIEKLQERFSA